MDLTQIGAKKAVNRARDAVAQIDNLLYRRLVAGSAGQRRTLPFSKTALLADISHFRYLPTPEQSIPAPSIPHRGRINDSITHAFSLDNPPRPE